MGVSDLSACSEDCSSKNRDTNDLDAYFVALDDPNIHKGYPSQISFLPVGPYETPPFKAG